jgi:glucokinase
MPSAIARCRTQRRKVSLNARPCAAHQNGDAFASRVWLDSVRALAAGIASLINVLDPEAVVLGGGIMAAGDALLEPLRIS